MQVFVQKGYVIILDDEGNRNIAAEKRENRKIRHRMQRRKAGRQLNAQEPHRIRKGDQHVAGKLRTVARNREHRKAMRDAMMGLPV